MDILSPAPTAAPDTARLQAELTALRAQVASLQSERAALWWDINHDDLTGLANRRLLVNAGPALLAGGRSALMVLDLNGFKPINDQYGHSVGDDVLRTVARRLSRCLGDDLAVRLSGDEFAAILTESARRTGHGRDWPARVGSIARAIAEPMTIEGRELRVTASIGVATTSDEPVAIAELLRRADLAMYRAKADRYCSNVVWD